MVPFAGWAMPVQYEGVIAEHRAVRQSAGLFDVSHMGQVFVAGPTAALDLQRLLSNDIGKLVEDGQAQYTLLTNERGGIEDDLIVYRLEVDEFLLVVNASNVAHDLELLRRGVSESTGVEDHSDDWAMLALQGPLALDVLADHVVDVRQLAPFRFVRAEHAGGEVIIATTGYTGERGCELLVRAPQAPALWEVLAADDRVCPTGLGARDTLRLEVCYPLHGNDIDATTSAVSAGLGWVCGWSTDFVGRDALRAERERGATHKLVALQMLERGIPRAGCLLLLEGEQVGHVTSGTMSPTLGIGIALAYVRSDLTSTGTELEVDIRGKRFRARVEEKPLYHKETA